MDWVHFANQTGFSFDHPAGWKVTVTPFPSCYVTSPDGLWIALMQPLPIQAGVSPADVIGRGQFPTTHLFPGAKPSDVIALSPTSAQGVLTYIAADKSAGRAQLVYVNYGSMGMLCAIAAPAAAFNAAEPTLSRIVRSQMESHHGGAAPIISPAQQNPQLQQSQSIQYKRFTDPQHGSFSLDVPMGWQITGGLHHPQLGDRRAWFETNSPDGIYILSDPTFPHSLCHVWGGPNGWLVPVGSASQFLSLKPGADSSADFYLKQVGPTRLPNFRPVQRRPRPDIVNVLQPKLAAVGMKLGRKGMLQAVETILQRTGSPTGPSTGPILIASLLTTCVFNGDYGVGMGFWESNNILCIAPQPLAPTADAVRTHMIASFQLTPVMYQIVQQDESQIYANAQAANAAQWNWFAGQQAAHNAQVAAGDAMVNNYWNQQRANDSILRGWEQNQGVYDRLSQDRSDAMMGVQRLADDARGTTYDVPAGSNYYWRDQQSGQVIGTETQQPPDYTNNYTELRKL